jgi:CSLREA domain-containing protein/uncharacterized repeat protein (TIGR01451 family)
MQRIGAILLRRATLVAAATTLGVLAWTGVANAASFTVTTTNDSNDGACTASLCSLRDAVVAADAAGGSSTITVPAGTYKLARASTAADDPTTGDLDIDNEASVTINGAGSGSTIIDANGIDRAFAVQNGAGLTLSGMTLENGHPNSNSSGSQRGGAIWSDGALTTSGDVMFTNNSSLNGGNEGGAIYTASDSGSSLSITGATFDHNQGGSYGGSIYLDQPGTAKITQSTFTNNIASDDDGGAIYVDNGALNIDSSSFSGNDSEYGGVIYDNGSSTMTLTNSRFTGNTAYDAAVLYLDSSASTTYALKGDEFDNNNASYEGVGDIEDDSSLTVTDSSFVGNSGGYGGVFYIDSGSLSMTNATMSENSSDYGGALYFETNTPTSLTNDTIAHNTAGSRNGGGIFRPSDATTGSGATGVLNTIVADNAGGDCGAGGASQFASAVDAGHNLDSDSSCFQGDAATDKVGADPKLGKAADNGGPVLTDALMSGSPAIDTGTNSGCPSTDARGISRPQGAACDIGAFEAAASKLSVSNSAPANGVTDIPFTYTIKVTPTGPGPSTGTTVTDQLPAGETLYGSTPSQGSCSSSGSPAKVTCALGTVRVGKDATVTLLVSESKAGSVTDTAAATNDQGANVSASATTKLKAPVAPAGATAPKAFTYGHSNKTKHTAVVHGHVVTGGQPTWYFFQYGRSRFFGQVTRLVRVTSAKNVAAEIRHLRAGKKYFFRLVAVNDSGIRYGAMHSFRTRHNRRRHRHHHRLSGGYTIRRRR